MKFNVSLNKYAEEIYKWNVKVGWWGDDPNTRDIYGCFQLISTEVAEASEGFRKNLMDDHLPQYPMEAVELADALIRTLDLVGHFVKYYKEYQSLVDDTTPLPHRFCKNSIISNNLRKHLGINIAISNAVDVFDEIMSYSNNSPEDELAYDLNLRIRNIIDSITGTAESMNYPLEEIMLAKIEYNKHRADHKKENRAKPGGKKY